MSLNLGAVIGVDDYLEYGFAHRSFCMFTHVNDYAGLDALAVISPKVSLWNNEISLIRTSSRTERKATTNSRREFARSKNFIRFSSPAERTMVRKRSII